MRRKKEKGRDILVVWCVDFGRVILYFFFEQKSEIEKKMRKEAVRVKCRQKTVGSPSLTYLLFIYFLLQACLIEMMLNLW